MKEDCLHEPVDIVMIERNGGAFLRISLKRFLFLLRNLINPEGYAGRSRCFYCERTRKTKLFVLTDVENHRGEWIYCKDCALHNALDLLNWTLGIPYACMPLSQSSERSEKCSRSCDARRHLCTSK